MTKLRSIASQLCAALPYFCLRFSTGSVGGFHTILITELYKEDAEIPMTLDQLSWFASLGIINVVSSIINGFLAQRLGSRILGFITASLMITSWFFYFYSTNSTLIFTSRVLIALRATTTLSGPYISEISEPLHRSSLLMINYLTYVIGTFFSLLLGSFMYWRTIALVNISFPLLAGLFILFVTPNSPTWLINEGRLEEAEKALCWLRGWVEPTDVQIEFHALVESLKQSKSTEDERKLNIEAPTRHQFQRNLFRQFFHRSFYLPLGIMFIIYTLQSFNGTGLISTYTGVIFQELNSPIDVSIATAITGGVSVIGTLAALFLTNRTGKRKLVFISLVIATLCHLCVAIVGFLKLNGIYRWIPSIATIITVFANSLGAGTSVHILVNEIFPSSLRYIGTSMGNSFDTIMESIVKKIFFYIMATITMPGVFVMFFSVNLVAFVTYYFLFPETEGRSLKDIEDHYKGVKDLNECKK